MDPQSFLLFVNLCLGFFSQAIRAKPIEFEKFKNECTDELGDG